ncbi:MAG TPA: YicC/YloC family endoribonuclease [Clostridia bacterium]
MIKSMTGFGRGISQANGKEFVVEIKTVNHRYMDIFTKIPRQISFIEDRMRELVGKYISRGKIDIYVSYDDRGEESKTVILDEMLAKAYIDAIGLLKHKFQLNEEISVSLISRFPDVLRVEKVEENEDEIWQILKAALEEALEALVSMRLKEGKEIRSSLLEKADFIEKTVKHIKDRSPDIVKEYKAKLESRINELMEQQSIDESRLAVEVAFFADRCSIDEEIVRLGSHISQLRDTLNSDQPVGRKLDFLLQEMNREVNTIGSKANDLSITRSVIELKSELEKIREQIQNIE